MEKVAATFRAALRDHEDDAVAEMAKAYQGIRDRLQEKLDALAERMQQAEAQAQPITVAWLGQEKRFKELLQQVEDELLAISESQAPKLEAAQDSVVGVVQHQLPGLATVALGTPPAGVSVEWNSLPTLAIKQIVGNASDGSPLHDLLDEWGVGIGKQLRQELVTGASLGAGAQELTRRMQAIIGEGGDGNKGITQARAENIVRTELHRASRTAAQELFGRNTDTIEGWTWTASCDARCCPCCWAMHGSEHDISETLDGHPSCRCIMIPRTKSWADITGDPDTPDTRPVIQGGADKFAALGADKQRSILGPALFDLYSTRQITLADCVVQTHDKRWGSMRRVATVAEATASKPAN